MPRSLPIQAFPDASFARGESGFDDVPRFQLRATSLADRLPPVKMVINRCEYRYPFLQAFAATLFRCQTTLLPASNAPPAVAELLVTYPGCAVLNDSQVVDADFPGSSTPMEPPASLVAAIGHTSGSTGRPTAHAKLWGGLCATTALNAASICSVIGSDPGCVRQPWIVATVPPQHMYGFEMTVLLPLLAGFGIHTGRPLLPADVGAALEEVPEPRVLVSTPVHLRSLVDSGVAFPSVAVIVSATAPLSRALAQRVEERLSGTLLELFGSTETCVVATRRTAHEEGWCPHAGVVLAPVDGGTSVRAPWLVHEQFLHDVVELRTDGTFMVVGRCGDLIEVAGKRASLADLTSRLAAIPGVLDAIVFQPLQADETRARRVAALVVAPGLSVQEIKRQFRNEVDAVFVPRPLLVVPVLPRNELGKLPIERLMQAVTGSTRHRRGE